MKKRILCRMCLLTCGIFFLLFMVGGARIFRGLMPSVCEEHLKEGQTVAVKGRIYKKTVKETAVILYLEEILVQDVENEERRVWKSDERLQVILAKGCQIPAIGQEIVVDGEIGFFEAAPNPGNFDQKFYYQKQKIHAKIGAASIRKISGEKTGFREMLWQLREAAADLICAYLEPEEAGVLCAMLLGEKRFLAEEIQELYQKSGIGHLLATSGLHASFIGLGLYEILRRLRCPMKMAAAAGGMFLTVYVVMTGGSVSAVRACVMFLVRMGAVVTGREYDGLTALSLAGLLALWGNPLQMFDAGFLLSYGAVLGIYGIMLLIGRKYADKGRWQGAKKGMDALRISLAVQAVILPVLLYYYFEISFYSIIWNLIAIPAAGSVMGTGILGLVSGAASIAAEAFVGGVPGMATVLRGTAKVFFGIAGGILKGYEFGGALLLELPGARLVSGKPEWTQIVFYYLAVGGFLLVRYRRKMPGVQGQKKRRACTAAQPVLIAAALTVLLWQRGTGNQVEITMLDVGQGDSFFIRGPEGGTYLIDGGSSTVSKVGKYRLEPYLKSQGVGSLDYVWVTHGDADHLNAITEMILRQKVGVKIRRLVLPEEKYWDEKLADLAGAAKENGVPVFVMEQGSVYQEGEMSLICLWPGTEAETGNESSLVLSLHFGEFDMLFTGDLENEGEKKVTELLKTGQEENVYPSEYDVLKIGHHGSKNATGEELLEAVKPACAFLSSGKENRYGHPHEETLERLAKWDVSLYNTKDRSAVKLYTDGKKYCILRP